MIEAPIPGILPQWPLPDSVGALFTTRNHGFSDPPYGRLRNGLAIPGGLNLGLHAGDDARRVAINRGRVAEYTGGRIAWLDQVHGSAVVDAGAVGGLDTPTCGDGAVTDRTGTACAIMVADCLPVLIADTAGRAVGAAHAGWRGLAQGVIENTVAAVVGRLPSGATLTAWLGPCIGAQSFEVGAEVRACFLAAARADEQDATAAAFVAVPTRSGKFLANLPALATLRLRRTGISLISQLPVCTYAHPELFYSYRRDGVTGRMAALIWLKA